MTYARGLSIVLLVAVAVVAAALMMNGSNENRQQSIDPPPGNGRTTATTPGQMNGAAPDSPFEFTFMTPESGVDFLYYGSPTPDAYMTEQNGGGVALLDFDTDGRLDLFFVNGSNHKRPAEGLQQSNRLYRAVGDFRYEDVTEAAGLVAHGFGMGCAAGDYDNDGFTDLFVAYYGGDRLWKNNGDGTFTEVTQEAGVAGERWGTSAAFADLDGDGTLDLYVVNYVDWSPDEPPCHPSGHPEINIVCNPMSRTGQADYLYRNLGDGRFIEVGDRAGIALADEGKGLALAIADFDADGRLDVYVANDTSPNFLFRNRGDMQFDEVGVVQGVAISGNGVVGAGMGVACADFDRNGWLDLCVTNFRNQINDVFANLGSAGFFAANTGLGVDLVSRSPLSFGVVWADFDLDTWPDMFIANGHIWDLTSIGTQNEYKMPPQFLWNRGGEQFVDVSGGAGEYFQKRWLGRAVAAGDLDNDGDSDLVVTHLDAPPAILRNDIRRESGGARAELIGTQSARYPLGTRLTVTAGGRDLVTHVPSGGSFQAGHDRRVLLPADAASIARIQVSWTDDRAEVWTDAKIDEMGELRLVEGEGEQVDTEHSAENRP